MAEADSPLPLIQLTSCLRAGDDTAWLAFHRDYGPAIFRQLLAGAWGDHDLAAEALQLSYLRIARHVRPCDSPVMFRSWLRTVARSVLNDCLRKRRTFNQLRERRRALAPDSADENEAENRLHTALDTALAELDADDRELLIAKYFSGATVRGLAGRLQISEKAVESRLTRARTQLRDRLVAELSCHE